MINLKLILASLLVGSVGYAAVDRRDLDLKLPTQQQVEKQTISAPAIASTTAVLSGHAGPTSGSAVSITSGITQPDVPRALVITPGGTTADVAACTVTVTGKNIQNGTISETFAFLANASTATTGAKAFKSVSSIAFPASCEDSPYGATWSVGTTDALGLNKCMDKAGHVLMAVFDGVYESTRPTCIADADEVEKNTCDINGTLNDTKNVELFYFQNFRCKP